MIHSTAIIDPSAKIAKDVSVGPYTVIGKDVEIGANTCIGAHVVLQGNTKIGKNNKVFQFASLGIDPQHKQYKGEDTTLIIGDNNVIREYASIHRGTSQGIGTTIIGNSNFLMAYTHIAHDCILGDNAIFANNATLAGHVSVGNCVVLGGFVKILQFCNLGDYCFVSGDTGVTKDVLPYTFVSGQHGKVKTYGLNLVGLRRQGFSQETLREIKNAYNIIYRQNLSLENAIGKLKMLVSKCPEIERFIAMLEKTKKGIVR